MICAHLRPGRIKRRSTYLMQPITGLHIGSLIDRRQFDEELYHTGPVRSRQPGRPAAAELRRFV
jgi:hypothetical protein